MTENRKIEDIERDLREAKTELLERLDERDLASMGMGVVRRGLIPWETVEKHQPVYDRIRARVDAVSDRFEALLKELGAARKRGSND